MGWKVIDGGVEATGPLAPLLKVVEGSYESDCLPRSSRYTLVEHTVFFAKILQELQIEKWSQGGVFDRRRGSKLAELTEHRQGDQVAYPVMPVLDFIASAGPSLGLVSRVRDKLCAMYDADPG